jgi:hypothetical protein
MSAERISLDANILFYTIDTDAGEGACRVLKWEGFRGILVQLEPRTQPGARSPVGLLMLERPIVDNSSRRLGSGAALGWL